MKVREPVARPVDVVAVELLLSASQAFVTGALMYLAVGIWDDRGVGVGPVAIVLALLGISVGGSWLFWLLGGTGWPLAAANVPASMFFGFAIILGWQGDSLIRLDALPLLLALAGSVFGIVGGVFLDSPRRWRWDQRQKLRPGTEVPRVSPTTRAVAAWMPRSLPKRAAGASDAKAAAAVAQEQDHDGAVQGGAAQSGVSEGSEGVGVAYLDRPDGLDPDGDDEAPATELGGTVDAEADAAVGSDVSDRSDVGASGPAPATSFASPVTPVKPQAGPGSARSTAASETDEGAAAEPTESIELPTSIEPKAQRSPWAWAAPPEWNRDEDDDEPETGSKENT